MNDDTPRNCFVCGGHHSLNQPHGAKARNAETPPITLGPGFEQALPGCVMADRDYLAERVLLAILPGMDVLYAGDGRPGEVAAFCYRMADAMAKAKQS